jgi:hydrogenase nickel incorporation protein HypA/HybF
MHELGLCEAIVEAVERRASGRRVTGVRVRIGALHRVVEPALEQAFALAAAGSVAEGAEIEVVIVPLVAACRDCDHQGETTDQLAVCDACGSVELDVSGGEEFVLESVRYDAPVAAAAAPGAEATGPKAAGKE